MLGIFASQPSASTPVDPVVLAYNSVSVATAVTDLAMARTTLEPGGDGVDVGDLIVAMPKANATTQTWSSKSGDPAFTLFAQDNTSSASAVLYRIVTGTESWTNITMSRSAGTAAAELDIWRIQAGTFDPSSPLDVASFVAASGDATLPSMTTTARGLIISSASRMVSSTLETWTPPSGMTDLFDVTSASNNLQVSGAKLQMNTPGATGTKVWDQTGTGAVRATMVLIKSKP